MLVNATTWPDTQGMKEKVDSLMAAGKLFVVDHEPIKVACHNRVESNDVTTALVVENLGRGAAAPERDMDRRFVN